MPKDVIPDDNLFKLINEFCTSEQVTDLLRTVKGTDGVRITAEDKQQLIDRNLRDAVQARVIPLEQVLALLQRSEESGGQHIFYFVPNRQIIDHLEFHTVGTRLFGGKWPDGTGLPRLDLIPKDYVVADFRQGSPRKPRDWVFKMYGHEVREHATDATRFEEGAVWKRYDQFELRHVLIARWYAPYLLELRVPTDGSKKRIGAWVERLWDALPFLRTDFKEWELGGARRRLLAESKQNADLYQFHDTEVEDSNHGKVEFSPHDPGGSLFAAEETEAAIQGYLRSRSACRSLSITWLRDNFGPRSKPLRTQIGYNHSNEVVIAGKCEPDDVDYVTEQLRHFSRRAS